MCDRYTPKSIYFAMKNPKTKKILLIAGIGVDVALTIFLFVLSIVLLANMPANSFDIQNKPEFLRFFYDSEWHIPVMIVVPLFVLLALNIFALFMYVKKTSAQKKVKLNELSEAEKEALRRELMKDLAGGAKEEEKPAEEAKNEAEPEKEE